MYDIGQACGQYETFKPGLVQDLKLGYLRFQLKVHDDHICRALEHHGVKMPNSHSSDWGPLSGVNTELYGEVADGETDTVFIQLKGRGAFQRAEDNRQPLSWGVQSSKDAARTKTFPISTDRSANRVAQWEEFFHACPARNESEWGHRKKIMSIKLGCL